MIIIFAKHFVTNAAVIIVNGSPSVYPAGVQLGLGQGLDSGYKLGLRLGSGTLKTP